MSRWRGEVEDGFGDGMFNRRFGELLVDEYIYRAIVKSI